MKLKISTQQGMISESWFFKKINKIDNTQQDLQK